MIFTFLGLLFTAQIAVAEIVPFSFMNHVFKFYQGGVSGNYETVNIFISDGLEQNKYADILSLTYNQTGINLSTTYDANKRQYEATGNSGTSKKSKYKIAFSSLEKQDNNYIYALIKIEDNDIAGSDIISLKLYIPDKKADIKKLDEKYFNAFYKTKFPRVQDENGEMLPHLYPLNFNGDKFVLKYSLCDKDDATNYYLTRKQNFYNYKSIVRINTRSDINSPEKLANIIIDNQKAVKGFKLISNETYGKDKIISYINNEINIKRKKTFVVYSIFKIVPAKKGVISIEYSIRIPDDEKASLTVSSTEQKYRAFLKTYEIPELIKVPMGMLPALQDNDYMEQTK